MILEQINDINNIEDNFYKNKNKGCDPFCIPFADFTELYFYVDLGTSPIPTGVQFYLYDNVGQQIVLTTADYVIGKVGNNYYLVFTNFDSLGFENFAAVVDVNDADEVRTYTTDLYCYCENAKLIEACLGAKYELYNYYDVNGVYYGYPEIVIDGNPDLRYKHISYLLGEVINPILTKTFTNTIVNNAIANSQIVYDGSIYIENAPEYFFKNIETILARGEVIYDGKNLVVESFISTKIDCCNYIINGKTKQTDSIEYDCKCDTIICDAPIVELLEPIEDQNNNCSVEMFGGWSEENQVSPTSTNDIVDFNIDLIKAAYNSGNDEDLFDELLFTIIGSCVPCEDVTLFLGLNRHIDILTDGQVLISGTFSTDTIIGMVLDLGSFSYNKNC
ncbi:MAG: hypothetical protein ACEQSR_08625 [Candidatus Methylacidiphilales bacterium]